MEEYFPDPDQFRPERWTEEQSSKVNFAALPFGYGSRLIALIPNRNWRSLKEPVPFSVKDVLRHFETCTIFC